MFKTLSRRPQLDRSPGGRPRACCVARRKNVRLNIEQLELRDCPAVSVVSLGDSLTITGDAYDNLIQIEDRGGGALNVNGSDYSGIRSVVIDTKDGADEVRYRTVGVLSPSAIQLRLGSGNDVADLKLGAVSGTLRSEIDGGDHADTIGTAFDSVSAGADARSVMDGGSGNDVINCAQSNVAGIASCITRGGSGNDTIDCVKNNVVAGGRAECISDGESGNDEITCAITDLAAGASALCQLTGGSGDDTIACDKTDVQGQHVCFIDGGSGNDVMNWNVRGTENSGDFQCNADAGTGDDRIGLDLGSEAEVGFTGKVKYFADTGAGNDAWSATVNFREDSDGVISSFTVLLGSGNDTGILNFLDPSDFNPNDPTHVQFLDGLFSGGSGEDTYLGPPPFALPFSVEKFEIGV